MIVAWKYLEVRGSAWKSLRVPSASKSLEVLWCSFSELLGSPRKYLEVLGSPWVFLLGIRRPIQGVERVGVQEQGLQLPSIQPAAIKPTQPASPASQPASQPTSPASPASPAGPASQPASQPSQPARRKGFYKGSRLDHRFP